MRTLGELLQIAGQTLPLWRDAAVVVLAGVIIGCLYFYASVYGE